jgi:ankyrin repeat protein
MAQLLLEKGATINTFDKKDRRAIHWAAYMGHIDVVRLLVSFGAELGCRDKQVRLTGYRSMQSSSCLLHLCFYVEHTC